jgi:hypothetical protein
MMRVATCDTVTTLGENGNADADTDMADDGDTDETRVVTSSSLYGEAEVGTNEKRKSDVVVRESGELEIPENAAAYSLMEWEIGIAR